MAKTDWKDLLGSLSAPGSDVPASGEQNANERTATETGKKQDLVIRFEKRGGKPATIVSRFEGSESGLKELAAALKKHCGTGGSAKDDEILIQGDVRTKVADYLKARGHRVRGDFR